MNSMRLQAWILEAIVLLASGLGFGCYNRKGSQQVSPPPQEFNGPLEANHPWIVFDPTDKQDLPVPFSDNQDPNILYLIFVMEDGSAVKINLAGKTITPCQFKNDHGDPAITVRYLSVSDRAGKGGGWIDYSTKEKNGLTERVPIWDEFRGQTEKRRVSHMYGYPFPTKPGERDAWIQTGSWYVMDERHGKKIELLRVKIKDSELVGGDSLGDMYLSPNKRWIVFTIANHPARTFIFDREAKTPEVFE
jgi:hypothetical protein